MSETKPLKPSKSSKPNPFVDYFETSVQEIRKVTWPTRQQAIRMTVLVIGFCLVAALILGAVDFIFNFGYRKLVEVSPVGSQPSILDELPITTTGDEVKVDNVTATGLNGEAVTVSPTTDTSTGSELTPRTIAPAEQPGSSQQ